VPHQPSLRSQNLRERRAFTLIELLVVISIIAVIAALLLPTMNFMRKRAESTQCLGQLRQIGVGIAAYMNDNGTMPGPLNIKQGATYDPTQPGSLAGLLANYLGNANTTAGSTNFSPLFLCPAAYRKAQNKTITTFFMNMLQVPEYGQSIWGDISLGQQPLSKAILGNWYDATDAGHPLGLSEMWAIQDADLDYLENHTNFFVSTTSDLLPLPAHDDHYNALFFDMHAERRVAGMQISEPAPPSPPSPNPTP
jgi:prepilin-type N-terminal cleavage/methylation domain-containing protein